MQKTVLSDNALRRLPGASMDERLIGGSGGYRNELSPKEGKRIKVLMVLVPSATDDSVPVPKIQLAKHPSHQVIGHLLIIDKS